MWCDANSWLKSYLKIDKLVFMKNWSSSFIYFLVNKKYTIFGDKKTCQGNVAFVFKSLIFSRVNQVNNFVTDLINTINE